jgi:predicted DNA-binding transcriptional regulator YafY
LRQAAESAVIKLLAALPAMTRHNAEAVRQRIHVDGAGWRQWEEQVPALPALQAALWQDRKVQLLYQRGDETTVERIVDPLGLVVKGRVWYLVAAVDDEIRTYRVSRIQHAKLTDHPCVRPAGFDLATHWEQSVVEYKTSIPRYPASLRVDPALLPHIRTVWRYARLERIDEPDVNGWVKLEITYEGEADICQNVLSCGPQVEVLGPPALRERVRTLALSVVALYDHGDGV